MVKSTDVIVVGGGIIGCFIAYYLYNHGIRCTIIERDGIGSQASGSAAGLFNPLMSRDTPEFYTKFAIESHKIHAKVAEPLKEETGIDYHYGPISVMRLAFSGSEVQKQIEEFNWLKSLAIGPRLLQGDSLSCFHKWLSPYVQSALITNYESQVEPYQLMIALMQALEKRSCTIKTGEAVDIVYDAKGTRGIKLKNGDAVYAEKIVLTLGPWINTLNLGVGLDIPVKPIRGQILTLDVPLQLPSYWISYDKGYIAPKLAGHVIAGTTEEDAGFSKGTTEQATLSIMSTVLKISPIMREATLKQATACLRPLSTKDNLPFIGEVPHMPNLYIATGHGKKGILLSAATGKYLAQLIATKQSDWDLSPFSLDRLYPD